MWKQILIEMVIIARYFTNSISKSMVAGLIGQVVVIYRLNKEKMHTHTHTHARARAHTHTHAPSVESACLLSCLSTPTQCATLD